jgi:hypothetical protein
MQNVTGFTNEELDALPDLLMTGWRYGDQCATDVNEVLSAVEGVLPLLLDVGLGVEGGIAERIS